MSISTLEILICKFQGRKWEKIKSKFLCHPLGLNSLYSAVRWKGFQWGTRTTKGLLFWGCVWTFKPFQLLNLGVSTFTASAACSNMITSRWLESLGKLSTNFTTNHLFNIEGYMFQNKETLSNIKITFFVWLTFRIYHNIAGSKWTL